MQRLARNARMRRRSGVAILYAALGLSGFLGVTALVVDMGNLYTRRAQAQRAADAAALAGALELPNSDKAKEVAAFYANLNGYTQGRQEVPVLQVYPSESTSGANRIKVVVQRSEPLYFLPAFAALMGSNETTSKVGATAVAEKGPDVVPAALKYGTGTYGVADGVANPSVFGPYGFYEYGDPYSPHFLSDGSPNVAPPGSEDLRGVDFPGYTFHLDIAPSYKALNEGSGEVQLEIFDPDCFNADGQDGWDEIRPPRGGSPAKNNTTTKYSLFAPDGRLIAEATYTDDAGTDLKWTTPEGFKFNIDDYGGAGRYKLQVKALDGSSENGFEFRAGRPHDGLTSRDEGAQWAQQYNNNGSGNGTTFSAEGKVPMNFRTPGSVTFDLGYVPGEARGGEVFVDKFDTDIGYESITYKIRQMPLETLPPGSKAENGTWGAAPDRLPVPTSYPSDGSIWTATYNAGTADTSCWTMNYTVPGRGGSKGGVKLVQ
jgi:Flp pilus assembly protein TadG